MIIPYAYDPTMNEPWMWGYLLIIANSTMILITALILDYFRDYRRLSRGMMVVGALGVLIVFTPPGFLYQYVVHIMFISSSAPAMAKVFTTVFSLWAYYMFCKLLNSRWFVLK